MEDIPLIGGGTIRFDETGGGSIDYVVDGHLWSHKLVRKANSTQILRELIERGGRGWTPRLPGQDRNEITKLRRMLPAPHIAGQGPYYFRTQAELMESRQRASAERSGADLASAALRELGIGRDRRVDPQPGLELLEAVSVRLVGALGPELAVLRCLPYELTLSGRQTTAYQGRLDEYALMIERVVRGGDSRSMEYWDYSVYGKTGVADVDRKTADAVKYLFFPTDDARNPILDQLVDGEGAATNTSMLGLLPTAAVPGLIIVGALARTVVGRRVEDVIEQGRWMIAFRLAYEGERAGHAWGAAIDTRIRHIDIHVGADSVGATVADFVDQWGACAAHTPGRGRNPEEIFDDEGAPSAAAIDVDAIGRPFLAAWRDALDAWFGSSDREAQR